MAHKQKRTGFVLDMTPLVDIAFLLLTFFMFTAKFKSEAESEQKFEIKRPTASADTTKLPELGTAIVKIAIDNGDTTTWFAIANEQDRQPIYSVIKGLPDSELVKAQLEVQDTVMLGRLVLATRRQDRAAKFVIDADKNVEFGKVQQVMNTLRTQGATIFNFVTVTNTNTKGGGEEGAAEES